VIEHNYIEIYLPKLIAKLAEIAVKRFCQFLIRKISEDYLRV